MWHLEIVICSYSRWDVLRARMCYPGLIILLILANFSNAFNFYDDCGIDKARPTLDKTFSLFKTFNMFVTCFHEFRIYKTTNFFYDCFLLKHGRFFLLWSKMLLKLFIFTKKRHFAENKTFFVKICHKQVICAIQVSSDLPAHHRALRCNENFHLHHFCQPITK